MCTRGPSETRAVGLQQDGVTVSDHRCQFGGTTRMHSESPGWPDSPRIPTRRSWHGTSKKTGPYLKFHSELRSRRQGLYGCLPASRETTLTYGTSFLFSFSSGTRNRSGDSWNRHRSINAAAKTLAIGKKRSATVIALKADDEDLNDKDVPHVFNQSSFLSFVEKLDYAWTGQGMAGI